MDKWTKAAELEKPFMDLGRLAAEAGVTVEEKPADLPNRPGFSWKPCLNTEGGSIGWQEVEDPNAQGTNSNPIVWESGMKVYVNYWYTHNDTLYVCVKTGTPARITNTNYFEMM